MYFFGRIQGSLPLASATHASCDVEREHRRYGTVSGHQQRWLDRFQRILGSFPHCWCWDAPVTEPTVCSNKTVIFSANFSPARCHLLTLAVHHLILPPTLLPFSSGHVRTRRFSSFSVYPLPFSWLYIPEFPASFYISWCLSLLFVPSLINVFSSLLLVVHCVFDSRYPLVVALCCWLRMLFSSSHYAHLASVLGRVRCCVWFSEKTCNAANFFRKEKNFSELELRTHFNVWT